MTEAGAPPPRPLALLVALLCAWCGMIIYASLAPFGPWQSWRDLPWSFLSAPPPRHVLIADLAINIVAYLPLGSLSAACLSRRWAGPHAVALAVLAGFALSLAMELLQAILPPRIPSNVDLVANTLGAALGALPWLSTRWLDVLCRPLERWRAAVLLEGGGPELGASLLLLWCACQLNPSIPFLGAGVLQDPDALRWYELPVDRVDWLLQAISTGFNAVGLGLFLACLLNPRVHPPLAALLTLISVLGAKAAAAEWLLKPALVADWFGSATMVGLAGGALSLVAGQGLVGRARVAGAAICLLAGGLLAKLDSHYAPLSAIRSLFGWNFLQLRNFAGLTVWLNEIWPLLALLFLVLWLPYAPRQGNRVSSGA